MTKSSPTQGNSRRARTCNSTAAQLDKAKLRERDVAFRNKALVEENSRLRKLVEHMDATHKEQAVSMKRKHSAREAEQAEVRRKLNKEVAGERSLRVALQERERELENDKRNLGANAVRERVSDINRKHR